MEEWLAAGYHQDSFRSSSVAIATNSSQTEPADTPRSALFHFLAGITVFSGLNKRKAMLKIVFFTYNIKYL